MRQCIKENLKTCEFERRRPITTDLIKTLENWFEEYSVYDVFQFSVVHKFDKTPVMYKLSNRWKRFLIEDLCCMVNMQAKAREIKPIMFHGGPVLNKIAARKSKPFMFIKGSLKSWLVDRCLFAIYSGQKDLIDFIGVPF